MALRQEGSGEGSPSPHVPQGADRRLPDAQRRQERTEECDAHEQEECQHQQLEQQPTGDPAERQPEPSAKRTAVAPIIADGHRIRHVRRPGDGRWGMVGRGQRGGCRTGLAMNRRGRTCVKQSTASVAEPRPRTVDRCASNARRTRARWDSPGSSRPGADRRLHPTSPLYRLWRAAGPYRARQPLRIGRQCRCVR